MKHTIVHTRIFVVLLIFGLLLLGIFLDTAAKTEPAVSDAEKQVPSAYWLLLQRGAQQETVYYGTPGNTERSTLVKAMQIKPGIPNERPTPLPQLVGREYWNIIAAEPQYGNPETAPYFLTLDIPGIEDEPYGPVPYNECSGQCNWVLPGAFGLHGVAYESSRLSDVNPGSSGCIRHSDEDITYLYYLLKDSLPVRYYILP